MRLRKKQSAIVLSMISLAEMMGKEREEGVESLRRCERENERERWVFFFGSIGWGRKRREKSMEKVGF